ncbi:MAG: ABC transporter ATP-binding protein [Pseudobdellovibrionaceae bacterium]
MNLSEMKQKPLWYFIKYQPRAFCLGLFFLLVTNGLDSAYPLVLKWGLDLIQAQAPQNKLLWATMAFFALMVSLSLSRYSWRVNFGYFHTAGAEHLRSTLFRHITDLSLRFFHKTPVGDLISLATNDIQSFRMAIGPGLLIFIDGISIICFVLPIMIYLNPGWAWKVLIFLPLVPFFIWLVMKKMYAAYKIQQDEFAALTSITQETIGGIRVIKSFAQEDFRTEIYNRTSKKYENSCNKVAVMDSLFSPIMEFGIASGSVILIFIAADGVMSGAVSVGMFVAYHRYIQKMVWPMSALGYGLSMMQKGYASFSRIRDFLNQESEIKDTGLLVLEQFQSLEFKNICFTYPGSTVTCLQNISFRLQAGENLGILGPVGSGKTTLLHLLCRLYNPDSGEILINDSPIENYTLTSLRQSFLMVPQDVFLFSDTVAENISYGLPQKAETPLLQHWTQVIDMQDEVTSLPQNFDTQLGERGVNLSGGQKQRLTIARGLMLKSQVVILDDSLSAVDTKTEKNIQSELQNLKPSVRSQIVVSHRLSSIKNMDKILILDEGRVESFGTYTELSQSSATLKNWIELQQHSDSSAATEDLV